MSSTRLQFRLEKVATASRARAATFRTLHNEVQTPLFMPVGTKATVKAQLTRTLEEAGTKFCSRILITCCCDRARRCSGASVAFTNS